MRILTLQPMIDSKRAALGRIAVLLGASVVAAALSACSGSGGENDNDAGACIRSCAGKQCGPDGCGGSCGSCNDENRCTGDTCSAQGICVHNNLPDQQACHNLTIDKCQAGVPSTVDCRAYCKSHGQNIAATCGHLVGCRPDECCCDNDTANACTRSTQFCQPGTGEQVSCDPVLREWSFEDCRAFCASFGYTGSDGCRPAPFSYCTCLGVNGGKFCHGPGGDCSDDLLCCSGLVCTWQYFSGAGSFYSCLPPKTCEPRCMEGSVCCGGAFCSGDCIANPCCS
jgi:hypothetical protein